MKSNLALLMVLLGGMIFSPTSGAEGVTKVVVGWGESYLIHKGSVYVWGRRNSSPEMNLESSPKGPNYVPYKIPELSDVEDLQSFAGVTCALAKGKVKCWGEAYQKSPWDFNIKAPPGEVIAFSVTYDGLCLASAHRLACTARDLGRYRLTKTVNLFSAIEFTKEFSSPITQVVMTTDHICVLSGGRIYCVGQGFGTSNQNEPFNTPIKEGGEFVQISGASSFVDHTTNGPHWLNQFCARTQEGAVYCWGNVDYRSGLISDLGKHGYLVQSPSFLPLRIGEFDKNHVATDVATVTGRTFAVQGGKLFYWGKPLGFWKRLAVGMNSDFILHPSLFTNLKDVKSVAASETHFCAITAGGVYCVGNNVSGELGTDVEFDADQIVTTPQKVVGLPDISDYAFNGQDLREAFKTLQKITVEDKSQILMRVSKQLGSDIVTEFPSESLLERQAQVDREFANGFIILSLAPLFNDFAAEPGTEAQTDLEKIHATYQKYIHEKIEIQKGITDLSVIRYSSAVAGAAREMLDASLRALGGVSGEANFEAYQNLLAEVSKTQDLRSVVPLVEAQREWIENTAAANQSKRCFAQMVLNITEYLRGNL